MLYFNLWFHRFLFDAHGRLRLGNGNGIWYLGGSSWSSITKTLSGHAAKRAFSFIHALQHKLSGGINVAEVVRICWMVVW